jgi:hypothetical protein
MSNTKYKSILKKLKIKFLGIIHLELEFENKKLL